MKVSTAIGSIVILCTAFLVNANAATTNYSDTLDLTNLQYPVTTDFGSGIAAADIIRFDLGTGLAAGTDMQLTTGAYYGLTTTLGFALTTDPNDTLYSNPSAFLQLANSYTDATDFFNDHVTGWELYLWGYNFIASGGTTDITGYFSNFQFDPNEHYYAFLAGGSVSPTTVGVDLAVSSVPVPAAVWLFGSGIVGLIGAARRKMV